MIDSKSPPCHGARKLQIFQLLARADNRHYPLRQFKHPRYLETGREAGFSNFVCAVERLNLHVTDMTPDNLRFRQILVKESRQIVSDHKAEIIVPFGTSFLPTREFASEICAEVGVPFVNCVEAGVNTAEMLVSTGLKNSRKAYPLDGLSNSGVALCHACGNGSVALTKQGWILSGHYHARGGPGRPPSRGMGRLNRPD